MSFLKELLRSSWPARSSGCCRSCWCMVVFGGLLVLAKGSAVAPFIYTLF